MSTELRSSYRGVAPGTRLNGIYEIDQMIGAGGMGEVYKSHEIQTGASVAIKMLLPDMADNEAALGLFRREAAALHHLVHDAIVRYFLFSVDPTLQRPYLAMEFVNGVSLSDVLASGPLSFEALVKLMRRIASGLNAAHERGIIHRDVSPDNIIVPLGDVTRAKIIDFGIARYTQLGDKTIIGSGFAGKDNYVSPEQVGLFGSEVTAKSDIYSLGLLLFYALTGQKLDMGGSQFQLVEKRRRVPDLGGVDMRIRPLLEKMLQPDPENRPSTMAEIANWRIASSDQQDFKPLTSAQSRSLRPAGNTAAKPKGRPVWLFPAAAGVIAALAGGTIYAFYSLVWSAPLAATAEHGPHRSCVSSEGRGLPGCMARGARHTSSSISGSCGQSPSASCESPPSLTSASLSAGSASINDPLPRYAALTLGSASSNGGVSRSGYARVLSKRALDASVAS